MECGHTPSPSPLATPLSQVSGVARSGEEDVPYSSPHLQQVTLAEYKQQARELTPQAVKQLKASPEYKRYTQKCSR